MDVSISPLKVDGRQAAETSRLRDASKELEATFVFEMLKSAGMGESRDSFGGGAGEDQFSSLLLRHQARALTNAGGLGLAEAIFTSLKNQEDRT